VGVLAGNVDPGIFDLMPRLAGFVPPAAVIDKMTYSAFGSPAFLAHLDAVRPRALIFTGVETDVCVLATVLDAVDHGYRAILVKDALASGEAAGHASILDVAARRYGEQIELIDTETLLKEWRP
jgi:nicotinamidase-related amidase